MDWLNANKEWIFSGLGITILAGVGWVIRRTLFRSGDDAKQYQRSGAFSKNSQIGSISVGRDEDEK